MAGELLQDYAFHQLSRAIMATANSVTGAAADGGGGEGSIFDVVRRKISRVQDVLQGFTAPLKRRSMYEELPEHVWPQTEHIEMSRLAEMRKGRGHIFRPCQLTNPTWCDYCGDFIWGLFKQCQRCENCQLTSHEQCVPLVTLNCITVPEDAAGPGAGAASTPSPSDPKASLETSLSLGRPGCARSVSSNDAVAATTASSAGQPLHLQGAPSPATASPKSQVMTRTQSLPDYGDIRQSAVGHHTCNKESTIPEDDSIPVTRPDHISYHGNRHSAPCLPGLPPPPSAIDELTQGNDDARFITSHGQPLHPLHHHQHHHIPPPSSSTSSSQTYQGNANLPQLSLSQQTQTAQTHASSTQSTGLPPAIVEENPLSSSSSSPQVSAQSMDSPASVIVSDDASHQSSLSVKPEGEVGAEEKDETDSGYRSGTIPDDKLPKVPSQATLDRQELKRKITKYNHFVPAASFEMTGKDSFQGFVKVTMNLIRPITMELGARPPSIYELLTREHIIEENTQQVAFYMPRDTHKSLHITSETTTREVVSSLLKKFHILDHPRKFAMYEQEFNDKNKLVRLRRLTDKSHPLAAALAWDPERIRNYRMVLQENETGEIVWEAFSLPELGNFLKVLDREEKEIIVELRHKYAYMKQIMEKRLAEFKSGKLQASRKKSSSNA